LDETFNDFNDEPMDIGQWKLYAASFWRLRANAP
jgi:hypothetical protein